MFLGLITQRPSELSDTCVSQCANFIILRTMHPVDLKYIKEMVPNISSEIVLQLKNLKPGNCIAFGSAFKVPTSMYIDIPNPRPLSNNVDLDTVWYATENQETNQNVQQPMEQGTSQEQQEILTDSDHVDVNVLLSKELNNATYTQPQQPQQAAPSTPLPDYVLPL